MPKGKKKKKDYETEEAPAVDDAPDLKAVAAEEVEELASQADDKGTALLLSMIADLKRQVEGVQKGQVHTDLGPPPPSRNDKTYIMVWVNPWNMVRVEVPEDYDGPGADGTPVKGFQNHENTLGNLLRR